MAANTHRPDTHRFSIFRLSFGVLCLLVAAMAALDADTRFSFNAAWLWVAALAVVGIAGLVSLVDLVRSGSDDDGTAIDV